MKGLVLLALFLIGVGAKSYAEGGNQMTAAEIIEFLGLIPLPEEGGYYRETYRSGDAGIPTNAYGSLVNSKRLASTAIYYLVTPESFSALHRVKSDEIFHFYSGDPVEMIQITPEGQLKRILIGNNLASGELPQVLVPKGVWQGTRLVTGGKWSLMGTTVAPGFEFEDFEAGPRAEILKLFPQHREDIIRFTREPNEKAH